MFIVTGYKRIEKSTTKSQWEFSSSSSKLQMLWISGHELITLGVSSTC